MNLPAVPVLAEPTITEASCGEARESTEADRPATDHRALERGSGSNTRGGGQKIWVFAFRVEPPPHTVMVRFGAVVLDAAMRKNEQV